ncbi:TPA: hypothetical protein DCZ39_04135 [Patescibacteria group bacterium]|nr:hypothetical protein [Candidatus Gracilibacteria bacterium]
MKKTHQVLPSLQGSSKTSVNMNSTTYEPKSSVRTIDNLSFLKALNEKTVKWNTGTLTPNLSGRSFQITHSEFTSYKIPKSDFKKVLEIVREECLLFLPHTTLTGFIDGYGVHDLDGQLVLLFGEQNIPKDCGFTLKKIFNSVFRSEQNLEIYKILENEATIVCTMHETFEQYCY